MLHDFAGAILWNESGIQVMAGLSPSSHTVQSLLTTPLAGKASWKKWMFVSFQ